MKDQIAHYLQNKLNFSMTDIENTTVEQAQWIMGMDLATGEDYTTFHEE